MEHDLILYHLGKSTYHLSNANTYLSDSNISEEIKQELLRMTARIHEIVFEIREEGGVIEKTL